MSFVFVILSPLPELESPPKLLDKISKYKYDHHPSANLIMPSMTDRYEKEPFFPGPDLSKEVKVPTLAKKTKIPLAQMDRKSIEKHIGQLSFILESFGSKRGPDYEVTKSDLQKLSVYLKQKFGLNEPVYADEARGALERIDPRTGIVLPERPEPPADQQRTRFKSPSSELLARSKEGMGSQKRTPSPPPPQAGLEEDPGSAEKLAQVLEERNPAPDFEVARQVVEGIKETEGAEMGEMLGQDELPEEFSGSAINSLLDREMGQREFQSEMRKGFYEAAIEGGGCQINNPEAIFDKVDEEEDSWGLRKVEFLGKFNYIDRENRLIYPKEHEKWFDTVHKDGFRERQLWKKFGSEKEVVVALVTIKGVHKFISKEGQILDTAYETMEAYFRDHSDDVWSDIRITEYAPIPEIPAQLRFLNAFADRLVAYAQRYARDDQDTFRAFNELAVKIKAFREGEPDWQTALLSVESLIQESCLETGDKVHYYREILEEAEIAKIKVDFKFATSVSPRQWVDIDRFYNGTVVRRHNGVVKYNLMNDQGQLIYSEEEAFDYIGRFVGDIARVKRNGKWHFLSHESGELLETDEDQWFSGVFKPKEGLFRIQQADGRFYYMNGEGQLIGPSSGFEKAKDFGSNKQASVVFMGNEFEIDQKGDRVTPAREWVVNVISTVFSALTPEPKPKTRLRGEEIPLALPHKSVKEKPAMTGNSSDWISQIFEELIQSAGSLKETNELVRLFQAFREVISEEVGKKSKPSMIILRLKTKIVKSGLEDSKRRKLERFIKRLRLDSGMEWVALPALPVNFAIYFKGLLRASADDDQLVSLLTKLESLFYSSQPGAQLAGAGSLIDRVKKMISQSGLDTKKKVRLRTAFSLLLGDATIRNGANFERSFSMIRYRAHLQSRRARRQTGKGVAPKETRAQRRANENRLNEEFDSLCRLLEGADIKKDNGEAGKSLHAFEQYQKLIRQNPGHSFDHRKFGTAMKNFAHRIDQYMGKESIADPKEKSILRIRRTETIQMAIDVFEIALRKTTESADLASIHKHLGDLKAAMKLEKEAKNHYEMSLSHEGGDAEVTERMEDIAISLRQQQKRFWFKTAFGLAAMGALTYFIYDKTEPMRVRNRVKECVQAQMICDDLPEVTRKLSHQGSADSDTLILLLKSYLKQDDKIGISPAFEKIYSRNSSNLEMQAELFEMFEAADKLGDLQSVMRTVKSSQIDEGSSYIEILIRLKDAKAIRNKKAQKKALQKIVEEAEALGIKLEKPKGSKMQMDLWKTIAGIHEELGNKARVQEIYEVLAAHGDEESQSKMKSANKKSEIKHKVRRSKRKKPSKRRK